MRLLLVAGVIWVFACGATAQETPVVRVAVTPDTVTVGEPVQLRVTVLVPTWFPRPPTFPSFELANTITRLPPNSSRPTSERVGRDTWSGIVRNYRIYPLLGATYRVSDLAVGVTYANPGAPGPVTLDVPVPEFEFRGQVPTGAETLSPYVAGRSLTLTREIEGDPTDLQAGDALVLRYVAELDGMPAVFLPTLFRARQIPGVSVYAEEPVLEDDGLARRTETVTYVFESGGEFAIPEIALSWWNTQTNEIETASAPAINLSVVGPPLPSSVDAEPRATPWWAMAGWAAGAVLLAWLVSRGAPPLRARWRAYQNKRRQSERHAFEQLRRALRSGDPRSVHHALLQWLNRLAPGTDGRGFARSYGDEPLQAQIEELNQSLYSGKQSGVDLQQLEKLLRRARRKKLRQALARSQMALPSMNP